MARGQFLVIGNTIIPAGGGSPSVLSEAIKIPKQLELSPPYNETPVLEGLTLLTEGGDTLTTESGDALVTD